MTTRPVTLPDGRHGTVRHERHGYWHIELDADSTN